MTDTAERWNLTATEADALEAYADLIGESTEFARESFEEAYRGHYPTRPEFARQLATDTGMHDPATDWPHYHIDWTEAAEDLFRYDYDAAEAPDGGVFVFRVL